MQDLSFDFRAERIDAWGYICEVYVHTFENVYAMTAAKRDVLADGVIRYRGGVQWAGGQEISAGTISFIAKKRTDDAIEMVVSVDDFEHTIRCVRLVIVNLKPGRILNMLNRKEPVITDSGMRLRYPEGWRTMDTAMCLLGHDEGGITCLRSLDKQVREKRFAFKRIADAVHAELIFEESAVRMRRSVETPAWEISIPDSLQSAYEAHTEHIREAFHLVPWEEREDVPEWAREISLVAAIHGQHWSGYIFNDYAAMLKHLRDLCEQIEGRRILAYLPGWEGRYYWKYGDYRADDRMGGEKGLNALVEGAHQLGVKLMPMFGINVVNCGLPNYEQWGAPSEFRSASGNKGGGSVDWDASRHYDHGSNRSLNPAAPLWQEKLLQEMGRSVDVYGFDAVFLDIAAVWVNDPSFELYPGVLELVRRLREGREHILVAGEAWYDGLSAAFPLLQSGHSDGPMNYHDAIYPPIFDTWCRNFSHLCLGDPSRGSTGVHELGTNTTDWRAPLRKGIWPTLTIVENSLMEAPNRVKAILDDAREYAQRYCPR